MRTNAIARLAIQLQMLSSSQIKYQSFFNAGLYLICKVFSKRIKRFCFNTGTMKLPRPDYYQGVLQLRDVTSEIIEFVRRQVWWKTSEAKLRTRCQTNLPPLHPEVPRILQRLRRLRKEALIT